MENFSSFPKLSLALASWHCLVLFHLLFLSSDSLLFMALFSTVPPPFSCLHRACNSFLQFSWQILFLLLVIFAPDSSLSLSASHENIILSTQLSLIVDKTIRQ